MRLLHSYVAARYRDGDKAGEVEILEEAWHLATGGDLSEVSRCHEALRESPEAHALFSHGIFVVENHVRASYEFADPAEVKAAAEAAEQARLQSDLRAARAHASDAERALAEVEVARVRVAKLEAALNLSAAGNKGDTPSASGDAGGDPSAADLEALALAAKASGATSLLEHVATLPAGASLELTPTPPPPRLADGLDLTETAQPAQPQPQPSPAEPPENAASASTPDAATQPSAEASAAGGDQPPAETGAPGGLDIASAAARARKQSRR